MRCSLYVRMEENTRRKSGALRPRSGRLQVARVNEGMKKM